MAWYLSIFKLDTTNLGVVAKAKLCAAIEKVWKEARIDNFCYPLVTSNLKHHCELGGKKCTCVDESLVISALNPTPQSTKWYQVRAHMTKLSKLVPNTLLLLHVDGEADDDYWRGYFKDGKSFIARGKVTLVFEAYDDTKLK